MDDMQEIADDISDFKSILDNLMDLSKNIEAKTDIAEPFLIAFYEAYANMLIASGYIKSGTFMKTLLIQFLKYSVSKNRKGRNEIIKAVSSIIEATKSKLARLTTLKESNE